MRQRRLQDLEERLQRCSEYIVEKPDPDIWQEDPARPLYLEIGCGKGDFIISKAFQEPGSDFVAVEGQESVIVRALEKAFAKECPNVKFTNAYLDHMEDFFRENQLEGVYLNFSDPWPKARHAKRRLTHRQRMADYAWGIRPGGFIAFKTDNEDLFTFTLEEVEAIQQGAFPGIQLETVEFTRDLHGPDCSYEAAGTMTEYEKKFCGTGKNINYIKLIVRKGE